MGRFFTCKFSGKLPWILARTRGVKYRRLAETGGASGNFGRPGERIWRGVKQPFLRKCISKSSAVFFALLSCVTRRFWTFSSRFETAFLFGVRLPPTSFRSLWGIIRGNIALCMRVLPQNNVREAPAKGSLVYVCFHGQSLLYIGVLSDLRPKAQFHLGFRRSNGD